jgi:hypothetical protein
MSPTGRTLAHINVEVPITILGVRSTAADNGDAYALQESMWGRHAADFAKVLDLGAAPEDIVIRVQATNSPKMSATVELGNAEKAWKEDSEATEVTTALAWQGKVEEFLGHVEEVLSDGFGRTVTVTVP